MLAVLELKSEFVHFQPICIYRLLFANDFWHVLGHRSDVFGLLFDTRVVALLGLIV